MCLNFACLTFVARDDYESILTAKISRFTVLCPKHLTASYRITVQLWETILDDSVRARVNGINCQMKTFQFYFGVSLLHSVLSHTDNLSKTLQHTSFSAAEGQRLAKMTTDTLQSIRSEEMFKLFWQKRVTQANTLDIEELVLPRIRNVPRRYEVGSSSGVSPLSPESHYRTIYYETIDTVIACISDWFNQEGYHSKLEQMLVDDGQSEEEIDEVLTFYGSDFKKVTVTSNSSHPFKLSCGQTDLYI